MQIVLRNVLKRQQSLYKVSGHYMRPIVMPFIICCWPSDWREVQQAWVPGIPKQQSSCTPIIILPGNTTLCAADELMLCRGFDAGRNNKAALVECIVFVGRAHCRR